MRRRALLRMAWITLHRDRLGLALYAIVPILFLTIFASVFQGFGRHGENKVRVALLDLDGTAASTMLAQAAREGSARIDLVTIEGDSVDDLDRLVSGGSFPAGILVPTGFEDALAEPTAAIPALQVRFDPANPIAPEFAQGVLLGAAWEGLAPMLLGREIRVLEMIAGPLTPRQRGLAEGLASGADASGANRRLVEEIADSARVPIDASPVALGQDAPSLVTYYTAAIGVMFMLFSALSTTGWLLEEQERGILDRLRSSGIGPWAILLNRFIFATLVGVVQMLVMLAWAAMVFDVRFFTTRQLICLTVLVPLVAASASALGLLITGVARTRRQQTTIGTIAVLILSALGGSMIPTFLMPESLQSFGEWFFNARAIDALQQVLWYTSAGDTTASMLMRISPAIGVVVLSGGAFLIGARIAISRWN